MKGKANGRRKKPDTNSPWGLQRGLLPLLPKEPRIIHSSLQTELTESFLLPRLAELEAFLLAVRARVDLELQQRQPVKLGKPYPLGQCWEITLAVEKLLRQPDLLQLEGSALQGYQAFTAFLAAGGALRQVWGDLRGEYFQNAFQLGTLYVDVSNDTVVLTKPKVEILPFAGARLSPVVDYRHFRRIAESYWKDRIFPNHVLPALAPFCPLLHINPLGEVSLREPTYYMVDMTRIGHFRPSKAVLQEPAMPVEVFAFVRRKLEQTSHKLAASPVEGRAEALRMCQEYRKKRWYASSRQTWKIMDEVNAVNACLIQTPARDEQSSAKGTPASGEEQIQRSANQFHFLPVSANRHAAKRWNANRNFHFARADMVIDLAAQELPEAMLALPAGFIADGSGFKLVVLQGLLMGKNTCVAADGRWLADYLPQVYRHYPFALLCNEDGEKVLCIDENSGLVTDIEQGEQLFTAAGKLTPAVISKLDLLAKLQDEQESTSLICADLQQHGLIQPWPIKVQNGSREQEITGLYRIDAAALASLPDTAREELHNSGALAAACCQLTSMQQLQTLGQLARTQV